jgi:hypothetical protein
MAQSAVEWLATYLKGITSLNCDEVIQKAKEMDKQQHGQTWDAAIAAHDNRGHVHARSIVDFDEYFEQTFKK